MSQTGVCYPKGFLANGIHCGIRKNKSKKDLCLIYSENICAAASVYTQNKVKGAPIAITKENLSNHLAQAIVVNSGNANTCNSNGEQIAREMAKLSANALGIQANDMIVASTGVIGQKLDITPIANHIQELADGLSVEGGIAACEAIMTTDTTIKEWHGSFVIDGKECRIGGIAKGSGMIHPNMATMLSFITSDVDISTEMLNLVIKEVADETFNMVSVDGDTSTNDMLTVMCNGQAENPQIREKGNNYAIFKEALFRVAKHLARAMAKDGEGATKLLTCQVVNAPSKQAAKCIAKSVIASSLVKSAMFGNDANWGRILCAIGYSDADYDETTIDVTFTSVAGSVDVCKQSQGVNFDEEQATQILKQEEVIIYIDMNQGKATAESWGCDLTYDYVKINGDYRT
ncbi:MULTISPECIES: bifunctional ornithine acetyltransferase/N-acetylglutamate synthase [unclassified Breznakia]|uniref:bifunctional ornithine acetyltransferase/N-acetylglutamate synthase n=1 Tax=unclassified Breznakia TaxID=2623764 RepID=UPI0024747258|nr:MULTISPECIES: bifunctional ornithine acetyltransferase/N-acetylglutamate synthase [unclassified Breznakia]MDH6366181.1 glutamate N-acetyltransferase/amino-acid N-acetyltransferase [Breznakia sp. PH1-1]MDH6403274.1 glutamate N-acetyltransferase/amino-acid N-acetyltransferase [Breznakia sp. PF1-11]MDH6410983.1 glutamate N-acetyltransferase/amino-acid N-acetyltransferase [Breznakia sp. PFB1-11]MDH6413347.1 glutamate N-acetyltransferase/amino-acid N-acetyltransferase [Breznakia sp. PFB1-14]MDH6